MFFQQTIIKAIAGLLIVGLLTTLLYTGYAHIKQIGYNEAELVYQKKIQEYQDTVLTKINTIETLSTTLAEESKNTNESLSKDINTILAKVKGKPVVIIKNGECVPSQTFSNSISEVNKRANQAVRDSRK